MRALTDRPAVFIPPRMIGKLRESTYATLCLCCHVIGLEHFSGSSRPVCEFPLGSTIMCDLGSSTCSMLRPMTTESSSEVTRISVQAFVTRKRCNSSWATTRNFILDTDWEKSKMERTPTIKVVLSCLKADKFNRGLIVDQGFCLLHCQVKAPLGKQPKSNCWTKIISKHRR